MLGTGYFAGSSHCGTRLFFNRHFKVPLYAITAILICIKIRYSSRASLQLNAHNCTCLGIFVIKLGCLLRAVQVHLAHASKFIAHESWTSAFNARERCMSAFNTRVLHDCMRVLSKDKAIALKLLTFAVPKDDNAFFNWRMLQVSTNTQNYRLKACKNSDC